MPSAEEYPTCQCEDFNRIGASIGAHKIDKLALAVGRTIHVAPSITYLVLITISACEYMLRDTLNHSVVVCFASGTSSLRRPPKLTKCEAQRTELFKFASRTIFPNRHCVGMLERKRSANQRLKAD